MKNQVLDQELRQSLYNIDAEQAVLGTIILNNEYLSRVIEIVQSDDFYEPAHRKIFSQIVFQVEKSSIIANQITLKQFFDSEENIKNLGGSRYLATLLSFASGIIDIANYGRVISDLAKKRKLVMIGEDIVNRAYKTTDN